MLKIRYISDIHLEFGYLDLPQLDTDPETVLVLAGDVGLACHRDTFIPFLSEMSSRFLKVIYVLGNHEFYRGSVVTSFDKIKAAAIELDNVVVVENETVVVDNVVFICATLWSDFDNQNPVCMHLAKRQMNDFMIVYNGDATDPYLRTLDPEDVYKLYVESHDYIFSAISHELNIDHIPVVVTHHAPSYQSISKVYAGNPLNGAFATELGNKIAYAQPKLWIHGHMHNSSDYMIGETRILCNPRGYVGREVNPEFDPLKVIEV